MSELVSKSVCEIEKLTFKYEAEGRNVLDGVSLELGAGETLCILGANGSGKTTLLNCMAGLLKPCSGGIRICGSDISGLSEREISQYIAYVPQLHVPSFDYRVIDFDLMGRAPGIGLFSGPTAEDEAICRQVLTDMGIAQLAERSYMELSGGERQQILIARALAQNPEFVLFDEPTAHLDYGNQYRMLSKVKEMADAGYTVAITTHNPDHALLLGGQVAMLDGNGRLQMGTADEIITEENLRRIYGIDITIEYNERMGRRICLVPGLQQDRVQ